MKRLVIVPCGKAKIWKIRSEPKLVKAKDAYTSTFFKLNKEFARSFGDNWVILSAKYGFLDPETLIEDYDISFNSKKTGPISNNILKKQIESLEFFRYEQIIGLGGKEYRKRISECFKDYQIEVIFPFEGCKGIGEMQKAIKILITYFKTPPKAFTTSSDSRP